MSDDSRSDQGTRAAGMPDPLDTVKQLQEQLRSAQRHWDLLKRDYDALVDNEARLEQEIARLKAIADTPEERSFAQLCDMIDSKHLEECVYNQVMWHIRRAERAEQQLSEAQKEIAEAREACPIVRRQDFFDAPLLTVVNETVSQLFQMQSRAERAEQQLSEARRQQSWQPIEAAPKDGTAIVATDRWCSDVSDKLGRSRV